MEAKTCEQYVLGELAEARARNEAPWEHAGMACALRHGPFGSPCGYVFVPEGHPLHGVRYLDIDDELDVHGGVTFAGHLSAGPGMGWAIGFDMAHLGDIEYIGGEFACVRTDEECIEETNRLAEQLAALAERGE